MDKLAKWITNERNERNWSQGELARKAGISRPTISNYESGKIKNPDPETLRSIAKALNRPETVIFRAAGILSPKQKLTSLQKEASELIAQLPVNEQKEWVEMLRWKVIRHQEER
jgi:transcriptional regulator with XRE-family HTH domain